MVSLRKGSERKWLKWNGIKYVGQKYLEGLSLKDIQLFNYALVASENGD